MRRRPLLVILLAMSLILPVAAAQNESTTEDETTDNETTYEEEPPEDEWEDEEAYEDPPPEGCYEDDNGTIECEEPPEDEWEDERSYEDHPPEACYEEDNGTIVCEEPPEDEWEDEERYEEGHPPEGCYEDQNGTTVCEDESAREDPERLCTEHDDGAITCRLPAECQSPDTECPVPPECDRTGEDAFTCPPPEQDPEEPRDHGSADRGHADDPCKPHPDREDAMICRPPAECEGKLYETDFCTPPPECSDNGDGTFTCTEPEDHRRGPPGEQRHPDVQRDCRPSEEDPRAMICKPPAACEGKIGQTPECTPPPACSENDDGTFTCRMPAGDHRGSAQEDHRRDRDQPHDDSDPDGQRAQIRDEMRAAIQDAMSSFRSTIEDLREEYRSGKGDLEARYQEGKDELRAEYRACMDEVPANASRTEHLEAKLDCKQDAREGLRELRSELLAERDLLRQDLLGQAEDAQFRICADLEERLHGILMDAGIYDADLADVLAPSDLALCSGILLDLGSQGAPDTSGWLSSSSGGDL